MWGVHSAESLFRGRRPSECPCFWKEGFEGTGKTQPCWGISFLNVYFPPWSSFQPLTSVFQFWFLQSLLFSCGSLPALLHSPRKWKLPVSWKTLLGLFCIKIFQNYSLFFSALGTQPTHCNSLLHLRDGEKILFIQRELMAKLLSLVCVFSALIFWSGFFPRWRGWTLEIINPWDLFMVYKNFKNNLLYKNDFLIDSVRRELSKTALSK